MLDELISLPALLVCFIFVAFGAGLSVSGLLLVKKYFPKAIIQGDQIRPASTILNIIGAMVAILFAFVMVTVWQRYNDQNTRVVMEASMLGNLYRDSRGLGDNEEKILQGLIRSYTKSLVEDSWPLLMEGRESQRAWEDFNALYTEVVRYQPKSEREKIILSGLISSLNELASYRRIRLLHSNVPVVPPVLWYIIAAGAFISICLTYFFCIGPLPIQILFTSLHATILSLIIFFTVLLNYPYRSSIRITPAPIQNLLKDVYPVADLMKVR